MRPNPELNYWLDVKTEEEARSKILAGGNWKERTKQDMEKITKYLGITKKDVVLDFGCGMGRLTKEVSPLCRQIIGMDVSGAMLYNAFRYCLDIKNILLVVMQNESTLPAMDSQIDKIFSFLTIQHIEKPKAYKILKEFNRVLKKFGKVLIQYPNVLNHNFYFTQMRHKAQLGFIAPLIEFYSRQEIEMIFNEAGFEITEILDDGKDFYVVAEKVKDDIPYPYSGVLPEMKKDESTSNIPKG